MAEELQEQQDGGSTTNYAEMMQEAQADNGAAEQESVDPVEAAQQRLDQLEAEVAEAKVAAREAREKSYESDDNASSVLAQQAEQRVRDLQARVLDAVDNHEIARMQAARERARRDMAA